LTSAGRRVSLLNCFRQAGEGLGVRIRIIAGDLKPDMSAACAIADAAFALPRVDDPDYGPEVARLAAAEGVQLIIPTIDPELMPLALAAPALAAEGIGVNVSAPEIVAVARDKLQTARVLGEAGVPVPRGAPLGDPAIGTPALPFPLIAKPRGGSSSIGLRMIKSHADLETLEGNRDYLLQERLSGPEFTVNVFIDGGGRLRAAVPHRRIETRAGEVSKGRTERHGAIAAVARSIAGALPGARGALCFQCFLTERGPVVFEINARFGGGYPLAHAAGAHFTRWLIEETLALPMTANDAWREGILMLRHDSEIFV
jgi:carbamoyl-phosphate synthase large subunit